MFAGLIIQDISDIMSVNDVLILCETAFCGSSECYHVQGQETSFSVVSESD